MRIREFEYSIHNKVFQYRSDGKYFVSWLIALLLWNRRLGKLYIAADT